MWVVLPLFWEKKPPTSRVSWRAARPTLRSPSIKGQCCLAISELTRVTEVDADVSDPEGEGGKRSHGRLMPDAERQQDVVLALGNPRVATAG